MVDLQFSASCPLAAPMSIGDRTGVLASCLPAVACEGSGWLPFVLHYRQKRHHSIVPILIPLTSRVFSRFQVFIHQRTLLWFCCSCFFLFFFTSPGHHGLIVPCEPPLFSYSSSTSSSVLFGVIATQRRKSGIKSQ